MTQRSELPGGIGDAPFSRRAAVLAGVAESRMRANDLQAPHRGMRRAADLPDDIFWRARDCLQIMAASAVFSHGTAALLHGLPLPLYCDRDLHVSVPTGSRPPERRTVVGHEIAHEHWIRNEIVHQDYERGDLFALPVVSPALAWAQLADRVDPADLVAIGDAILAANPPLSTMDELVALALRWRGRRGARALAWAAPRLRLRSWSRPETLFRLMQVEVGIPEPQLNALVYDRAGKPLTSPDQSWPDYRVLLEYEGDGHRSKGRFRADITRYENYVDGGWSLVRVHAGDVFENPNPALGRLARRLTAAGWHQPRRELRIVAAARR